MNYIELINNFWQKDLEYNFSDKEIVLYFYLLKVSNSISWKNPFGLSNAMTIAKFGWGKSSFDTAKNNLKRAGLIEFKAGDGRGNTYQYEVKGIKKGAQKNTLSRTLSRTLSHTLSNPKPETSLNINQTKPNNKKSNKKDFDFSFLREDFKTVFFDWLEYKRERQESYKTQNSVKLCYENLFDYSGGNADVAREIIEKSIGNNWAGFFKLKKEKNDNNTTSSAIHIGETGSRSSTLDD